ncbi:MAG: 16S rRNA (cytidine(1402)-2'-O)-methyltransferase [Leptonema sp. (in: bacteria)]
MDSPTKTPCLYIIATPIGNLKDITYRAVETLKNCDLVLAEDTRKAKILFHKYDIHTPLKSFRVHQIQKDIEFAIEEIQNKKVLGFITDAGTPGISDPGSHLVREIREKFPEIPVLPIPGPSSLSTILSVSGWQNHPLLFLGFLSPKNHKRKMVLKKYSTFEGSILLFEAVHRIEKLLLEIEEFFPERKILVGREMTKKFEQYLVFPLNSLKKILESIPKKGEFTILIAPKEV